MTRSARLLFALALVVASLPAPAQAPPTVEVRAAPIPVSLDVQPRTFTVPQTLTVTWSAASPATACVASGYWSGNKPPSGTEQIAGAVGDSLIALTCSGPPVPLMLSWINPTKNIDGSDYTDRESDRGVPGLDRRRAPHGRGDHRAVYENGHRVLGLAARDTPLRDQGRESGGPALSTERLGERAGGAAKRHGDRAHRDGDGEHRRPRRASSPSRARATR